METLREIYVDTRSNGCYLKQSSSFHMNLPGVNIPSRKDLYVNVTDFKIPTIEKRINFSMYYGFDIVEVCEGSLKEYNFVFSSLSQFTQQLRCAVINDFLYKSKCVKDGDDNSSGSVSRSDDIESKFYVRYADGRFEMQLDEHCVLFASTNLFEFMGFELEVENAKNGLKPDDVLACDQSSDFMKVCKHLTYGVHRQFFADAERVCHLTIDKCADPVACFDGGRYNVVCTYDLMEKKLTSNYRKFDGADMRNISFSVLGGDFKAFDFGCCLKTQSLRFVINVVAKI